MPDNLGEMSKDEMLIELGPVVERELNRHLATAEEWFPHQYVPWSQGRDFDGPLGGAAWTPADCTVVAPAAFSIAPGQTMRAVTDVVQGFHMPGHTIDGFLRKAVAIAEAGIYDLRLDHDDVLMPLLRTWHVFELPGLGAAGERARHDLGEVLANLDAAATRFTERRQERRQGRRAHPTRAR